MIALGVVEAAAPAFDLNTAFSGGVGAAIVSAIIYIGKLVADRMIPSRSDARANLTMVIEGLNNMVKVLQEEKNADATRLENKQARIAVLEDAADRDYEKINELRQEIMDLRTRLAAKDRHILVMVTELRKLGKTVSGLDLSTGEINVVQITDVSPGTVA